MSMSKAALAAGLSALWLRESKRNPDEIDGERQLVVSRSIARRVDNFDDAFNAFASDGFDDEWQDFADGLRRSA